MRHAAYDPAMTTTTLDPTRAALGHPDDPDPLVHLIDLDEFGAFTTVAICGTRVLGIPADAGADRCIVCLDLAGE